MSAYSDYIAAEAGSAGALMASCLIREPGSKNAAARSCFTGQLLLNPLTDTMRLYIKRKDKPGPDIQDDEALLEYCNNHGTSIFHPSVIRKVAMDDVYPCTTGPLS